MILIVGSNGQLGREMQRQFTNKGWDYVAYDYPDIDITSPASIKDLVFAVNPSTIVNCAAYTNVDAAETDKDNAYKVNALGPKNLAELCQASGVELVHISTDYVFSGVPVMVDGIPRPYIETDACGPQTEYGSTKLEGEMFVKSSCEKYYILRTGWLYGEGHNFVKTMLRLSENRNTLSVVSDQIGSPTSTADVATCICALIGTGEYGLYHATCEGQCSWSDFAQMIFRLTKRPVTLIPITSYDYAKTNPSAAPRPKWSVLENAGLNSIGKNVCRNWEDSIKSYLLKERDNK